MGFFKGILIGIGIILGLAIGSLIIDALTSLGVLNAFVTLLQVILEKIKEGIKNLPLL